MQVAELRRDAATSNQSDSSDVLTLDDAVAGPSVVVIMSTYQGERYVKAQLLSVLALLPLEGRVLVRDDGSTDGTLDEIASLQDARISLVPGSNIGFGQSFLTLLMLVPDYVDMVMVADQDDIWLPDKIERAWASLKSLGDKPGLYGGAQLVVDQNLDSLYCTPPLSRVPSLSNALTENIIVGCTAAINRQALGLLKRAGVPSTVRFHDWWLYLVVSAFGAVVYDDQPTLLYRQHSANVIGRHPGRLKRLRRAWRVIVRDDWVNSLLCQIRAFDEHYGCLLSAGDRTWIARHFVLINGRTTPSWTLVFSPRRRHQSLLDELAV
ncbi:MAG: glycosyltransferase, partial [Alphaproteobacteria bacterium]